MTTLPIRSHILDYLSTVDDANVSQVKSALDPEYGGERQFTWKSVYNHLMNLKENELLEELGYEMIDGNLETYYAINDEGRKLISKYVQKKRMSGGATLK